MAFKRRGANGAGGDGNASAPERGNGPKVRFVGRNNAVFDLNRRDFLKLLGISVSAAAASACEIDTSTGSSQSPLHIEGDLPKTSSFCASISSTSNRTRSI
jgi:hypothetical protein